MLNNGNKYICPYIKDKFIKDIYLGSNNVLGFNKTLYYSDNDSRIVKSGYDGEYFSANGYINFNAVCKSLRLGIGNIWSPGGTFYDLVEIRVYDLDFTQYRKLLYYYRIQVSSYSSSSNFTYHFELFNGSLNKLKETNWKTDYAFGNSFNPIDYDFTNNRWVFKFPSGSGSGAPETYYINEPYQPFRLEIENTSGKTSKVGYISVEVQN